MQICIDSNAKDVNLMTHGCNYCYYFRLEKTEAHKALSQEKKLTFLSPHCVSKYSFKHIYMLSPFWQHFSFLSILQRMRTNVSLAA